MFKNKRAVSARWRRPCWDWPSQAPALPRRPPRRPLPRTISTETLPIRTSRHVEPRSGGLLRDDRGHGRGVRDSAGRIQEHAHSRGPKLSAAYQARFDRDSKAMAAGEPPLDSVSKCLAFGMPRFGPCRWRSFKRRGRSR